MNLRKLELFGFKSFMRKLDIHFSDGITVIVGPNGCGKTNVTDALRWVLGEGNARMLRGKTMEDLIFNGTRDYKPLNVAEVGLTVDNSAGILPIDYAEVTVTRRVYRDGESEFLINKVPCRLKDIHDLFLDTGLGSRAYSVIEREMVEMVLGSEPEKRRELLEEAAGIMKYKIRERAAHRKLQATDEDVSRINDILAEVERQVRALKRQVGAAQRYQETRDRLRGLDAEIAYSDVRRMRTEENELAARLEEETRARTEAETKIAGLDAEIEAHRTRAVETEGAFATIQREVDELLERVREEERENWARKERRESLLETARRLAAEREELETRIRANETRREERGKAAGELEAALASVALEREEAEATLGRVETDLEGRRAELSRTRESAEAVAREVLRVKTEVANHEAHRAHLADREAVLSEEARLLEETLKARRAEADEVETRRRALKEELAAREADVARAVARREEFDATRETLREETGRLALELESARSGLEMLRGLHDSFEGFGAGARALLADGGNTRPRALADSLHVNRPDLTLALETALGPFIEILVAGSERETFEAIEKLRAGGGRATLLDRGALQGTAWTDDAELPNDSAILGRARSFLDASDDLGPLLDALLSRVVVVESFDDARRLARRAELRAYRFVTKDGEWASHPGLVHGGASKAAKDTRILGRADRIATLEKRVAELETRIHAAAIRTGEVIAERDRAALAIREGETARDRARESTAALDRAAERAEGERAGARGRLDQVIEERASLTHRAAEVAATCAVRIEELRVRDEERAAVDAAWRERESELAAGSSDREAAQRRLHDLVLDSERRRSEFETLRVEMAGISEQRAADEEGIARRTEEVATTERLAMELAREIELGLERFAEHSRTTEERRRIRDDVARGRSEILDALRVVEEERNRWARVRDRSLGGAHEAEMRGTKVAAAREERLARMKREIGVDLEREDASAAHGRLFAASDEELEAARRELGDLETQLSRLGPVNLVALEQYDRESKRLEFLASQKADLEAARESLRRTIRKINRTARALFIETLEQVRVNFKRTYGTLFEGGHADVRLSGDEDPLLASVEIFARPRGKQLSNISLLSSGERALTAVAFLFAIYLVKPSPFCILDEVDAPLDDANIGRFLAMLKDVAKKTQFVMITHNKKTMEVADTMYGVTMEEPGVSKLVSVKLGRADGGEVATAGAGASSEERDLVLEESA